MMKKTLIALGLLAATTLSGCVVAVPRPAYAYGEDDPYYGNAVVVAPVVPVYGWGWYGGGWYRGGYGWHGGGWHGGGWHGGGHRR